MLDLNEWVIILIIIFPCIESVCNYVRHFKSSIKKIPVQFIPSTL